MFTFPFIINSNIQYFQYIQYFATFLRVPLFVMFLIAHVDYTQSCFILSNHIKSNILQLSCQYYCLVISMPIFQISKKAYLTVQQSLREKCSYSELFWSVFFPIQTEYGEIRNISPYSVRMRENADRKNSEYVHFSRSPFLLNS